MVIVVLLLALSPARGGTPVEPSLRDYVHTAWTQHDGIPLSSVGNIAQTSDGYLWITTSEEGLLRFDGVHFTPMPTPCGHLTGPLEAVSDGSGGLWLLCNYRIFHRDASGLASEIKHHLFPPHLRPTMRLHVDHQGRLWLWGTSITYLRADGSEGPGIPGTTRPAGTTWCHFAEDSDGNIWFSAHGQVLRIRDDRAERIQTDDFNGLAPSRAGGIYALKEHSVLHINGTSISTVGTLPPEMQTMNSGELLETANGVWFGTRNHGLSLLRHGRLETFGRQEGLSSAAVTALTVDREGTIWAGTTLGLHRFREPLAYLMSAADGAPPGMPLTVYRDTRGALWIGGSSRIVSLDQPSRLNQSIEGTFIAIGEDEKGQIWMATQQELGRLEGRRFVPVRDAAGAPITRVFSLRRDPHGALWVNSLDSGMYRIVEGRPVMELPSHDLASTFVLSARHGDWIGLKNDELQHRVNGVNTIFDSNSGIAQGSIHTAYEDGDSLWFGFSRGLSRWRNGRWTTWTGDHGLPADGQTYGITSDTHGRLWIMSQAGILALDRSQLDNAPDGQPGHLTYLRIGGFDRVVPHRGGMQPSPRVAKGPDGKLFFATFDAIAVVDAEHLNERFFVPPIVLESVLVNRRPVDRGSAPRFVKPEEVQFEYTALSLRNPENVRFRYRLEGYDKDWTDAGTQRKATYTALKPRKYRFRVIGSGSEGVWNEVGASYAFQIAAPFYETSPFLFAALAAVLTFIWMIHRYRLRLSANRIRVRMEAQAGERMRIAQDMHDTFLQGIHGSALIVQVAIDKLDAEPSQARALLERAQQMVAQSTGEARRMLSSLRSGVSSEELLITRLKSLAAQEAALYAEPPRVAIESLGTPRELRPQVGEDVYLIASEAFKNALRHAQARNVRLTVHFTPAEFKLLVEDDGNGIDTEIQEHGRQNHFGIHGMRERASRHAGVLRITSRSGAGTEVCLALASGRVYR